ncbi:MAG: 4Fe-4S binding protein [Calditrichaeota bacterium]|nr:4Fe-4S binding protein [Calditrichota bacterium]
MERLRRISQILFLIFFLYLFFHATYPYEGGVPAEIFLRISPLVAVITMIATRAFVATLIFGLIVLALSFFLGRYFCGWMCPLGTTIDLMDRLLGKLRRSDSKKVRKFRLWKFSILLAILVAAIFSFQFIWFFDPIVIMTRVATTSLYPIAVFFVDGTMNLLLQFGIFQDPLFSVYDFLRNSILPLEPLFFQQSVIFGLIFLGILLLNRFAKRFWCRYLCPLGAMFGFVSSFRLTKGISIDQKFCTKCGRCQISCKMDAIDDDFQSANAIECIECMSCIQVCPEQAISYKMNFRFARQKTDLSRRRFIWSTATGLLTLGLVKTGFPNKTSQGAVVRPPGALPEDEFLDRCVRCQECVKICSTTGKALQPAFLESGWEGIWTPMVNARHGYCEYNCILCGQVCPSGAIHPLELEIKKKLKMGLAYFDRNRCIPWYRNEDCLVCEEHCPLPDKAIKFDVREVRAQDGSTRVVKFPYVDESLCIGCGICVTKCPVTGPAGIFLTNAQEQRWGEMDESDGIYPENF